MLEVLQEQRKYLTSEVNNAIHLFETPLPIVYGPFLTNFIHNRAIILHVFDWFGYGFVLLPVARFGFAFEMDGSKAFIRRLSAIVGDRTWHAATVRALQWLIYGEGAGEWMRPRVANKRPSCWTRVIHKNVGMSSKVGFLSEKNAKCVFEAESIYEVFEK